MNHEKRNKHMTLDDRIEIQECLNKGMTFKAIAQRIGKDQTTVSKEVKLHGKYYTNSFTKTDECCPKLLKAPFVCNGCPKRNHSNCPYTRRAYQAKTAQKEYETVLVESREGISLTKYLEENQSTNYVEMDTVIGQIGGKAIMTFQFVNVDFMFGLLLDNKTAAEAASKIRKLKEKLCSYGIDFGKTFPVILTGNGGEFSNVLAFENGLEEQSETKMFFCDSNAPYQKPHAENNHTLFGGIAPTGTSFDDWTQDNVNLIFSHINAVKRKQFNGKSSYDMFAFTYSKELAEALGISPIAPKDVIQTSRLLKLFS